VSAPALHRRECFVCGCSEEAGCPGGCTWIESDLCSRCAGDFSRDAPICVYCDSPDCTRMGGLLLCTQAQIREGD